MGYIHKLIICSCFFFFSGTFEMDFQLISKENSLKLFHFHGILFLSSHLAIALNSLALLNRVATHGGM